jgi:hypothetical protein
MAFSATTGSNSPPMIPLFYKLLDKILFEHTYFRDIPAQKLHSSKILIRMWFTLIIHTPKTYL